MRIILHSGTACGWIAGVRAALPATGVIGHDFGWSDHAWTCAAPWAVDHPLADPQAIAWLQRGVSQTVTRHRPRTLFLSLPDAAIWLDTAPLLSSFAAALAAFSDDIRPVLHLAHPADALADLYWLQVASGRFTGLEDEARIARDPAGWWAAAHAMRKPEGSGAPCVRGPMPAVDGQGLTTLWADVFGADQVLSREFPFGPLAPQTQAEALADLGLPVGLGVPVKPVPRGSAPALRRMLATNAAAQTFGPLPSELRRTVLAPCRDDAPPLAAQDLAPLTAQLRPLAGGPVPVLRPQDDFDPAPLLDGVPKALTDWAAAQQAEPASGSSEPLSPAARTLLTPQAREVLGAYAGTPFWPRNRAPAHEGVAQPPFPAAAGQKTGTLIVACMKDEGPYILEWVAYHLAIGVGHFLIFTNGCSDGTNEILDRLAQMGHVTRCDNEDWKGKSPQQHALNQAMKMDVFKAADWVIHIDVDEYINIRIGNGTMMDLLTAMGPNATNLAMTWRLFGNGGVDMIDDGAVMERFTGCSPTHCPKPHTIWGFKSMTRNDGAYAKLSCHRPNKWDGTTPVKWVNGSMQDITREFREKGWRSSIGSVGFDAVQLNHYALRSRESFLIKRQRGRALHVDRSIGLNYWVRHDWNLNTDLSILRQVPRMKAMRQSLLADPELARLHEDSLRWHHTRARELQGVPMFRDLWNETLQSELSDPERVAYAAAAGMES